MSKWKVAKMNCKNKTLSKGLRKFQSEEANLPSKVAEFNAKMLSLKTEIRKLKAEIIAEKDRKQVEETRSVSSMVEEFQKRFYKLENDK